MKSFTIFHLSILTVCLGVSVSDLPAQSGGPYEIKKSVIASGGAQSDGGTFSIRGTIGQGAAGTYNGSGRYAARSGYWPSQAPRVLNGKICYTNGGNIWKMDPDGSNRQLVIDAGTNDIEPAWSPDGSKIAFKSDRSPTANGGIWVVNSDGTGLTVLTPEPNFANAKPTWSPDGTKIAFNSNRDGLIGSIYLMNADGSNVTRLTNQPPYSDAGAEWSPDGTRMIFETNQGFGANIGIVNLDGTGRAVIGSGQFPSWSPNGSKIIYALLSGSGYHIHTMNSDGSGITQLTFGAPNDQYPSCSPDGKKIVFARNTSGTIGLWTMNADGSNQVIFSGTNTIGNGYSDWQRAPNTRVGTLSSLRIDEAVITYSDVLADGNTTFVPIQPDPMELPPNYELCSTCPAYDISTTAVYTSPVTVCLQAPSVIDIADFNALTLFHGEGGVLVNRTISRNFGAKTICASVSSLSPFVLAKDLNPTAAPVSVSGRALTADGRGIARVRVTMTDSDGVSRSAITSSLGYFRFEDVVTGQTYIISVHSKVHQFAQPTQVVVVADEITGLDFTALP